MEHVVVQKYGGTSVGSLERIGRVADRLTRLSREGKRIVVVVSAMAGETDRLLSLAKEFGAQNPRELDALVATGEQSSSALLSLALAARGVGSVSLQGHQIPIRTDGGHFNARILSLAPHRIVRHLGEGKVVVVAGYQGVTDDGDISTLGRGGSDLTAVAIAAALNADGCQIFTDVAGVFTADPQICSDARVLRQVSYDEMLELANLGAKVLQARSVQLAKRYMIPVQVLSSFVEEDPGTWVKGEERSMEGTVVSAITCDRKESKISVRHLGDPIRSASKLFTALEDDEIVVDVIVQDRSADGRVNVTFSVPRDDFARATSIVQQLARVEGGAEVASHERVAKVSAVGLGMRTHSGVAAKMFRTLAKEGIEVMAVSTSDIKISCVIDDRYAELAVRVLHDAFGLAKEAN